jgi:hypothetical protein
MSADDNATQPLEDVACEDCLSKQFIHDRLEALWLAGYGDRPWMRLAVLDVAAALGVPLEVAKRPGQSEESQ